MAPPGCSFCGKSQNQVKKIIPGPAGADVYICHECIDLCNDILKEGLPSGLGTTRLLRAPIPQTNPRVGPPCVDRNPTPIRAGGIPMEPRQAPDRVANRRANLPLAHPPRNDD